jgi:hypothetical protein
VLNLNIDDGIELIERASEQKQEDLLMQRWILHYQDKITFEEFKQKLSINPTDTRAEGDTRTEGEILAEVKGILDTFRG